MMLSSLFVHLQIRLAVLWALLKTEPLIESSNYAAYIPKHDAIKNPIQFVKYTF